MKHSQNFDRCSNNIKSRKSFHTHKRMVSFMESVWRRQICWQMYALNVTTEFKPHSPSLTFYVAFFLSLSRRKSHFAFLVLNCDFTFYLFNSRCWTICNCFQKIVFSVFSLGTLTYIWKHTHTHIIVLCLLFAFAFSLLYWRTIWCNILAAHLHP